MPRAARKGVMENGGKGRASVCESSNPLVLAGGAVRGRHIFIEEDIRLGKVLAGSRLPQARDSPRDRRALLLGIASV